MGFFGAIPGIISGVSAISDMFKKKGGGGQIDMMQNMMPWQRDSNQDLYKWASPLMKNYQPGKEYTGDFTAGKTSQEADSLQKLTEFLGKSPIGDAFGAGKQQIMDTLGGKFMDPASSPYIQAQQKMAQQGLQDDITAARGRRGARGTYFTDAGIREEGDLRERTQNNLNALIGDFMMGERNKQFAAAPLAQSFDQHENLTAPLAKIEAGQKYGDLDRVLQQGDLEAKYKDFLRKQEEGKFPTEMMGKLAGQGPTERYVTAPTTTQPNAVSNIAEMLRKFNWGSMGKKQDAEGNDRNMWDRVLGVMPT